MLFFHMKKNQIYGKTEKKITGVLEIIDLVGAFLKVSTIESNVEFKLFENWIFFILKTIVS